MQVIEQRSSIPILSWLSFSSFLACSLAVLGIKQVSAAAGSGTSVTVTTACAAGWSEHAHACFCVEAHAGSVLPCAASEAHLASMGARMASHVTSSTVQAALAASARHAPTAAVALAVFPDPASTCRQNCVVPSIWCFLFICPVSSVDLVASLSSAACCIMGLSQTLRARPNQACHAFFFFAGRILRWSNGDRMSPVIQPAVWDWASVHQCVVFKTAELLQSGEPNCTPGLQPFDRHRRVRVSLLRHLAMQMGV